MSRIGKLPVIIPEGVEVTVEGNTVVAKGSKGELSYTALPVINVKKEENTVKVSMKEETREARQLFGLTRTLISNLVEGVSKGFEKRLSIHGVGYNASVQGDKLVLNLGFSHPVEVKIPKTLHVKMEKNVMVIEGAKKEEVGQFAADIRKLKKPEPYKGKGIRYSTETILRKQGKKTA